MTAVLTPTVHVYVSRSITSPKPESDRSFVRAVAEPQSTANRTMSMLARTGGRLVMSRDTSTSTLVPRLRYVYVHGRGRFLRLGLRAKSVRRPVLSDSPPAGGEHPRVDRVGRAGVRVGKAGAGDH